MEKNSTYEMLMEELTKVMKVMENSDSSLEEQITSYERGMKIIGDLNAILKNAEERIMIINKNGQEERFE